MFTVEQLAEVMFVARLRYEGATEEQIAEILANEKGTPSSDLTYFLQEAELVSEWVAANEVEFRAVAGLILSTPPSYEFNEGLIEDALEDGSNKPTESS